jgi:hypothetical protein
MKMVRKAMLGFGRYADASLDAGCARSACAEIRFCKEKS